MANNNNNFQFQQFGQQSIAQFFPQPQGSVYMLNNSNEIATVPVGTTGVSAAICLAEGVLYLKAMQNNNPMLLRYRLSSLDAPVAPVQQPMQPSNNSMPMQQESREGNEKLLGVLKSYDERIRSLEVALNNNKSDTKDGGNKEWQI